MVYLSRKSSLSGLSFAMPVFVVSLAGESLIQPGDRFRADLGLFRAAFGITIKPRANGPPKGPSGVKQRIDPMYRYNLITIGEKHLHCIAAIEAARTQKRCTTLGKGSFGGVCYVMPQTLRLRPSRETGVKSDEKGLTRR